MGIQKLYIIYSKKILIYFIRTRSSHSMCLVMEVFLKVTNGGEKVWNDAIILHDFLDFFFLVGISLKVSKNNLDQCAESLQN